MGDRLDTIDMGRKLGAVPFGGGGVGFHLTMWPGPRPTFLPIGILIHLAVWPQQTWAKIEGLCPLGEGELGPHLIQCGQGRLLPHYQVASIQRFGHN